MKTKTLAPVPYYGADNEVGPMIAGILNEHCDHVTIPFCGGCGILPHLESRGIVANDRNEDAINFFLTASGAYGASYQRELIHRCEDTLSHPLELECAADILATGNGDSLERAWAFWAQCWIGRKGSGGTKSLSRSVSVRRTANGGNNASRLRAAADSLPFWCEQLKRCEWLCCDFAEVIEKCSDTDGCGIYCDPPWFDAGDKYSHAFTQDDHERLHSLLSRFRVACVVVRYGDHEWVREAYSGWGIVEASSRTQANRKRTELIISKNTQEE